MTFGNKYSKLRFNESDFENGYSRNLLWRLWHASKALEMEYLGGLCARTIHDTMCEETVFWDLNYAMQYRALGTGDIMVKVLKVGTPSIRANLYEILSTAFSLWKSTTRRSTSTRTLCGWTRRPLRRCSRGGGRAAVIPWLCITTCSDGEGTQTCIDCLVDWDKESSGYSDGC